LSTTAKFALFGFTPDVASVIVPDTVTLAIFPFGGQTVDGLAKAVTTGGVVSILIMTGTEADKPAPFMAEQVNVAPTVSDVSVVGAQPEEDSIPDSGSVTVQLTVTPLRYHPLLPGIPEICGVI
jgi:hypothetical protein